MKKSKMVGMAAMGLAIGLVSAVLFSCSGVGDVGSGVDSSSSSGTETTTGSETGTDTGSETSTGDSGTVSGGGAETKTSESTESSGGTSGGGTDTTPEGTGSGSSETESGDGNEQETGSSGSGGDSSGGTTGSLFADAPNGTRFTTKIQIPDQNDVTRRIDFTGIKSDQGEVFLDESRIRAGVDNQIGYVLYRGETNDVDNQISLFVWESQEVHPGSLYRGGEFIDPDTIYTLEVINDKNESTLITFTLPDESQWKIVE